MSNRCDNVDPNQEQSEQGLHCLFRPVCLNFHGSLLFSVAAPAIGNFTPELPPPTTLPTTTKKYKKPYFPAEIDIETGGAKIDIGKKRTNELRHDKTNKVTMHPTKTQISLGIRPV